MQEDLLKEVEKLAKPTYDRLKIWGHGWSHILGVVRASKVLAEMEGADPVLCQIAAYCHDLGRLEEEEKALVNFKPGAPSPHAAMSYAPTKKILDQIGISRKDADDILEAVKIHNIRKYEGPNKVALILQDADRADGFGKFAVLRFAVFNCQIEIPEPKDDQDADRLLNQVREILRKDPVKRARAIEALEYAFGWVDILANTPSLKKYISEGYKFNQEFYKELKSYN
jgi:HD superfamily phosphodiesterase